MAYAGRVALAVVLAARLAPAATQCGEDEVGTVVRVGSDGGRMTIDGVQAEAAALGVAVRSGDTVVQANAIVLHDCSDWAKAVKDARRERKALLLLLDRDGAPVTAVIPVSAWRVVTPPASASAAEAGSVAKRSPAAPPLPPPLPDTVVVSYASIRQDLDALVPADRPPTSLTEYRGAVAQLRRAIATLSVRQAAPQDAVNALRVALRPFEAAQVAWTAIEGDREEQRRTRRIPMAEEAGAPYFQDSQAAAVLDEFPFLRSTVVQEPKTGMIETAGSWRPVQARQLLWEHGRTQLATLPAQR